MSGFLKFSEALSLAFHSLAYLADHMGENASARILAKEYGRSEHHLAKVIQRLTKAGILKSVRGVGGGCQLLGDPKTITLDKVYIAIEGPLPEESCMFVEDVCDGTGCVFGGLVFCIDHLIREFLVTHTISDMAEFVNGRRVNKKFIRDALASLPKAATTGAEHVCEGHCHN